MNLAFVINDQYVEKFMVTAYSCKKNIKEDLVFHVIHNNLTEKSINALQDFASKLSSKLYTYEVSDKYFINANKMGYDPTSFTAYYKTYIPYLLSSCGRVCYLDCDLIVQNDISDFYHSNINTFIGAVLDSELVNSDKKHIKTIVSNANYNNYNYFNSGVMLFNFYDGFQDDIPPFKTMIEYIVRKAKELKYHDQDVLNSMFQNQVTYFDNRYNYFAIYHNYLQMLIPITPKGIKIIHFVGTKPWKFNYAGLFEKDYLKYYCETDRIYPLTFFEKRKISAVISKYLYLFHVRNSRLFKRLYNK